MVVEIALLGLIIFLILSVEHLAVRTWWPALGLFPRYVMGVLGFAVPLGIILAQWGDANAILALAVAVVSAGVGSVSWHSWGRFVEWRGRALDAEEREAFHEAARTQNQ